MLVAEDGSLVRVIAAPQTVLRITHCSAHGTPFDLLRAMHLIVHQVDEAFEPEAGAYAGGSHGHDHAPAKPAAPSVAVAAAPHIHGPDCNHGHDHHTNGHAPTAQPVAVPIQIHRHKPHSH